MYVVHSIRYRQIEGVEWGEVLRVVITSYLHTSIHSYNTCMKVHIGHLDHKVRHQRHKHALPCHSADDILVHLLSLPLVTPPMTCSFVPIDRHPNAGCPKQPAQPARCLLLPPLQTLKGQPRGSPHCASWDLGEWKWRRLFYQYMLPTAASDL